MLEKKYFNNLDVCRTLLAVLVSLGHFFLWNGVQNRIPGSFFLAVDFFFVLSGFVLTQTVFTSKYTSLNSFIPHFSSRRFFRLYPLYICLFIVNSGLQLFEFREDIDPFYFFLFSALLVQSLGFDAGAKHIFSDTTIGIAWSISCELWIGLIIFPLVYCLREYKGILSVVAIISALLSMALIVQCSPEYYLNANFQRIYGILTVASLRCVVGFSLGIFAFIIYQKVEPLDFKFVIGLIEILVLILCIMLYAHFNYDRRNEFVAPFLFAVLVTTFALRKGYVSKLLELKQLKPIRHLSYSIYLVHPFYIYFYRKMNIPFGVKYSILYVLLVVLSAELLYQLIEKPGLRLTKIRTPTENLSDSILIQAEGNGFMV